MGGVRGSRESVKWGGIAGIGGVYWGSIGGVLSG